MQREQEQEEADARQRFNLRMQALADAFIEVLDDRVNVTPYYFESRGTAFEPSETISLARPGMPALEPPMGRGGT